MSVPLEGMGVRVDGPASYGRLYRSEYAGAVQLAKALGVAASAAEDVAQDAFIRVHQRYAQLDNPGAYLRTTVVNLSRDWHRRQGRERRYLATVDDRSSVPAPASELLDVLARLPYRWRAVLVLRYWADWTELDIAAALGCRPGTVKTFAARGLKRLRKDMPS
jgi:RNA polymerase sigma factor (sigma-70 family)